MIAPPPYRPALNNCRFEAFNVISTRDIKIGDELYVSYGHNYWYNIEDKKDISRHQEIINKGLY